MYVSKKKIIKVCQKLLHKLAKKKNLIILSPIYSLGQNKWNIWTTPPPISMMPKWGVFSPLRLHHCFGGDGG